MPKRPRIELIARALIEHEGRLLLCRHPELDYRYLPGGHVEFGEPARRALARELMEEAGLLIRPTSLALVTEEVFEHDRVRHEVNMVFHVERTAWPETISSLENDLEFDWMACSELDGIDLRPARIKEWLVAGACTMDGAAFRGLDTEAKGPPGNGR